MFVFSNVIKPQGLEPLQFPTKFRSHSRLIFGSDQMQWPEVIDDAIEGIESAEFLSDEQTRDISYNNAARFLRLSEEEIAKHHGRN